MSRLAPLAIALASTAALGAEPPGAASARALEAKEVLFRSLVQGDLELFPGSQLLKQVPASARVAVVRSAGEAVKAWTMSTDFLGRYGAWRNEQLPLMPVPPRTKAQLLKIARAEVAQQRADMDASFKKATPEQQKYVEQTRADAEGLFKATLRAAESPMAEENDRARYAQDLAAWQEANGRTPQDPRVRIRALLKIFLEETAGVDFKAALKPDSTFMRVDHEEKSRVWKAAYRAGPEATAAARAFAEQWMKELR